MNLWTDYINRFEQWKIDRIEAYPNCKLTMNGNHCLLKLKLIFDNNTN